MTISPQIPTEVLSQNTMALKVQTWFLFSLFSIWLFYFHMASYWGTAQCAVCWGFWNT